MFKEMILYFSLLVTPLAANPLRDTFQGCLNKLVFGKPGARFVHLQASKLDRHEQKHWPSNYVSCHGATADAFRDAYANQSIRWDYVFEEGLRVDLHLLRTYELGGEQMNPSYCTEKASTDNWCRFALDLSWGMLYATNPVVSAKKMTELTRAIQACANEGVDQKTGALSLRQFLPQGKYSDRAIGFFCESLPAAALWKALEGEADAKSPLYAERTLPLRTGPVKVRYFGMQLEEKHAWSRCTMTVTKEGEPTGTSTCEIHLELDQEAVKRLAPFLRAP